MWFFALIGLGSALSATNVAAEGKSVRAVSSPHITPDFGCIPIMEKSQNGELTGKMSCATDAQVREFCVGVLGR